MRIDGQWYMCDDGIVRPVLRGQALSSGGTWEAVMFLVDTGADRTVIAADVLPLLGFAAGEFRGRLGGIGGTVEAISIPTQLRFLRDDGQTVLFRGTYAGFADPVALDMSVLGRDLLNLFAVITDRPGDVVTLIGQRHRYRIELV